MSWRSIVAGLVREKRIVRFISSLDSNSSPGQSRVFKFGIGETIA